MLSHILPNRELKLKGKTFPRSYVTLVTKLGVLISTTNPVVSSYHGAIPIGTECLEKIGPRSCVWGPVC